MSVAELFKELLVEKWGKRKSKPNIKGVRYRYPMNAERQYTRYVLEIVDYITAPLDRIVTKKVWDRWKDEQGTAYDASTVLVDGYGDEVAKLNLEMLERQGDLMLADPAKARKGAFAAILKYGEAVDDIVAGNIEDFTQYLIGQAFDVSEPWVANAVAEWATNNYDRISSLTSDYITKVNVMVREGVSYGTSWEEMAEKLQKLTGLTKNHAKLIAVDQIAKLTSNLTRHRQTKLGITSYIWRTSRDERVRANHRTMEGVLCRWDNPDLFSPDEGVNWIAKRSDMELQQVGQAIRCRCHGEPYVGDILAEGRQFLAQLNSI